MLSIGIVGAGLIGRLTALLLTRQGYHVTLFDKDNKTAEQSAAYAAAGLLTPLGESLHSPRAIVDMGIESMKLWPDLLNTLDQKVFFQQKGSLLVSHPQDEGDYQHFNRFITQNFSEHSTKNINRRELNQLEPELGRTFQQGIYIAEEGQIDNRALLIALTKELNQLEKNNKLTWLSETKVEALISNATNCELNVKTLNGDKDENTVKTLAFDLVIDCRGLGAKVIAHSDKTNVDVSVKSEPETNNHPLEVNEQPLKNLRGVRGELFRLFAPDVHLSRPIRLMHPRYQLYIAPKEHNMYAVGATQIESDDTSPMTVRSAMELLSAAYSVHPGFGEAKIIEHISQLRPAFNDNQPHILANKSLIHVNGLYRHGYLISPVVAQQVVELVNNMNVFTENKLDREKAIKMPCTYSHLLPITSIVHEKNEHNVHGNFNVEQKSESLLPLEANSL